MKPGAVQAAHLSVEDSRVLPPWHNTSSSLQLEPQVWVSATPERNHRTAHRPSASSVSGHAPRTETSYSAVHQTS